MPITQTEAATALRLNTSNATAQHKIKTEWRKLKSKLEYYERMAEEAGKKYDSFEAVQESKIKANNQKLIALVGNRARIDAGEDEELYKTLVRRFCDELNIPFLENECTCGNCDDTENGEVSESEPSNQPEGETEPDVAE